MYVCMSVCLYVCMSVCLSVCISVCLYVCMSVCLYVCMSLCLYVCMSVWLYVCMYVCMYVCIYVCMYVCMYACMHVCTHACMHVCMYARTCVSVYVCLYVCSQNRHANTMSIGEWQRPVLAACASSARRPSRADGLLQALGECRRLANELRRGTWQVRQVRQQQQTWTTKRCSDSWLGGELAKQEFPARQSISIAASADKSKHVQQTCRSRTSSIPVHICRRPHAMSCDLVKGAFSSAPSAVSKLPRFKWLTIDGHLSHSMLTIHAR